jgi:hypothetical protein
MILRHSGSHAMVIRQPTPIPRKARPVILDDQPRISEKTMGYATKQSCELEISPSDL